jgi:3-deoxy-7-phosphoheptulonate synthase
MGALAAGACGLIVEVHPDPAQAMSDGAQSLDFPMFEELARLVRGEREERGERRTSVELGAGS